VLLTEGREVFRFETFGDEAWWTDTLQLHKAIEGKNHGGVGAGVSPATALSVGLKVDIDAVPRNIQNAIAQGKVNLNDPAVTLALLQLNAVVGVKATLSYDNNSIKSFGITCALCHSTVDDSFAPGLGHRLDGWANRDLNVGLIVSLAPNLQPIADLLLTDVATVKKVLNSWGPGRYDAWLDKDGKAFRPDGGQSGTLLPPAFGLAGVNLHTWTGSGSVPYWNAYVAATQMHGTEVTFFDPRLSDPAQYPVSARSGSWNTRGIDPGTASDKLDALQYYQLSIPAPKPPERSFNFAAAARGKALFLDKAQCATCHVPPLYTEPGYAIHTPAEIGIDSFQADRSPTHGYRTAPLAGLWTHQKGGFYHDGRYATLADVVDHYNRFFGLGLTEAEKRDLVQFLLSI
jgi:cytochrome c5